MRYTYANTCLGDAWNSIHRLLGLQRSGFRVACLATTFWTALLFWNLVPVKAGTKVLGSVDALQLSVEHASTREALEALAATFKLTYSLPPTVNRNLNGFYSGSLRTVLIRILDGSDFFIKNAEDGVEVVVLRVSDGVVASTATRPGSTVIAQQPGSVSPPPLTSYLTNN